ncbi:ABC transporter substrate-binding protein [Enterobacterales bacterium CwR94]|nr:ABC transporter substrate-binding protein [Enterobacterales bacterium CwR94]
MALSVMLSALLSAPVNAAGRTLTIATEGSYEPWNLTLPGGKLGGFEPELMEDLCQRMQTSCRLVVQNWDGMITGLNAGKFDVIMDAIVITPERQAVIGFTRPYASTPASFIALKGHLLPEATGAQATVKLHDDEREVRPAIAELRRALKGKNIGIAMGTLYTPFIDKYFRDIATIREYSASADALLDLQAERIDAVFDDVTFIESMLSKPGYEDIGFSGPKLSGPIWGEGEGMGIRKADTELKAQLDKAIAGALADGTVLRLSMKWFKSDMTP